MSFLPLVSALGINPSVWQNNDLFFDLREEDLMINDFNTTTPSELYGYPHLGHPLNHYNITPFEAVYADPQTYEHIKMQKSVEDQNLNDEFLVHLRNFILDEVEADIVALQNQTIGQNHKQNIPYKYRAWYKAKQEIHIGHEVTPKTNKGDYIIEATGDVTVRAEKSISIKPGFHAQQGADFHAQIWATDCGRPGSNKNLTNNTSPEDENGEQTIKTNKTEQFVQNENTELHLIPNPNEGSFKAVIDNDNPPGQLFVYNLTGHLVYSQRVDQNEITLNLDLDKGMYVVRWMNETNTESKKMIVR